MASPTYPLPLHAYLVMVTGCCITAHIFFTTSCSSLSVLSSSRSSIYQEVGDWVVPLHHSQLGPLYMHIVCSHQIHVDQRRSTVLNFPKTLCLGFNFFFFLIHPFLIQENFIQNKNRVVLNQKTTTE